MAELTLRDYEGWCCEIEAYRLLKKCSDIGDMSEWNRWRTRNNFEKISLAGVTIRDAYLHKANLADTDMSGAILFHAILCHATLRGAILFKSILIRADMTKTSLSDADLTAADIKGADLTGANLINTILEKTNLSFSTIKQATIISKQCQQANFNGAKLQEALFLSSNIQGTSFKGAIISDTKFSDCEIDDETDFTASNLASALFQPGVREKLEQNIRRKTWEQWYKEHPVLGPLTRLFWWTSNYGYSTTRLSWVFVGAVVGFALIYAHYPAMLQINGHAFNESNFFLRFGYMLFFAASSMVTLGFSNINVSVNNGQPHFFGMVVVSLNLMVGYGLLAALVTRLGVLFTSLGPKSKGDSGK